MHHALPATLVSFPKMLHHIVPQLCYKMESKKFIISADCTLLASQFQFVKCWLFLVSDVHVVSFISLRLLKKVTAVIGDVRPSVRPSVRHAVFPVSL